MLAAAQGNSLMSGVVRGNSSGGGLPLDFSGVFGNDNIPGQIQSGLERELSGKNCDPHPSVFLGGWGVEGDVKWVDINYSF